MGTRCLLVSAAVCFVAIGSSAARADLLDGSRLNVPAEFGSSTSTITPSGWAFVTFFRNGTTYGVWRPPGGSFGKPFRLPSGPFGAAATTDNFVVLPIAQNGEVHVLLLAEGATNGIDNPLGPDAGGSLPVVTTDGQGNAAIAMSGQAAPQVSLRRRGGRFPAARTLSVGRVEPSPQLGLSMASNSAGDMALVWGDQRLGTAASIRRAGATSFGAVEPLPFRGMFPKLQVAVTTGGDVMVATQQIGIGYQPLQASFAPHGGAFMAPQQLTANGYATQVLAGPDNHVALIDTDHTGGDSIHATIRMFDRTADGRLEGPQILSPPLSCGPTAVSMPTGATVVAFGTLCDAKGEGPIALVDRPPGGAPSLPVVVSASRSVAPTLSVNPSGAVVLSWIHTTVTGGAVVQAVVRDGSADLSVYGLLKGLLVVAGGLVDLPIVCSGQQDCAGTIEIIPAPQGAATAKRTQPIARRAVRIKRGTYRRLSLRIPQAKLRQRRTPARIVVLLSGVTRQAARSERKVVLVQRRP